MVELEKIWKDIEENHLERLKKEKREELDKQIESLVYKTGDKGGQKISNETKSSLSLLLKKQKDIIFVEQERGKKQKKEKLLDLRLQHLTEFKEELLSNLCK
ncbi:hypothetical protein [endosymbiont GvMRE of Glomus versiforme]|uniref:hypothetical protein n=1 Tax=endosymbiont GvMRE of Glomus versiforme TaxID=2039283 RepID=UPI0011C3A336|nr:hypothetical protein [endosymbiont GvMRE of Glomus versiforme]